MAIDWSNVTPDHIRKACELFDTGVASPRRMARNTFLLFNGRRYPAKFIRGLAYRLATGVELDPSRDYSAGMETVSFLSALGFVTEHESQAFGSASISEQAPTTCQPQTFRCPQ